MQPFYLQVRAPFAAFRWMQAGVYRATSPVIPPSAAWGLVLQLAGIETRSDDDDVTTGIRADAPGFEIAVGHAPDGGEQGEPAYRPQVSVLYQQLHSYPVGNSGKELRARTHGAKYWIAPARRELLVDFRGVIGVRGAAPDLRDRVVEGLEGRGPAARYGLPFAGDNNLLLDDVTVRTSPPDAVWYEQWDGIGAPRRGSCRLTTWIDRADSSRTETPLFAPVAASAPPDAAWVRVGPR